MNANIGKIILLLLFVAAGLTLATKAQSVEKQTTDEASAGINETDSELPASRVPPYLVVDTKTGQIVKSNDPFLRWAPASLTKLMTAYTTFRAIGLQHLALDSPVRITEEAFAQPPSKMGFDIGSILTVDAALKILMVKSANDISVALAQGVAGTEADFVQLMNSHARRLGMTDSRFQNPHGLHHPEQYTSARDMAVLVTALAREFPQHQDFFDIVWLRMESRRLRNHNALLRLYPGTNGMKTGYVCASGFNVIVRTKRNGRELAAIVFGGHSSLERNVRTAELLTAAFGQKPDAANDNLETLQRPEHAPVVAEDITRTLCPGKYPEPGQPAPRPVEAPTAAAFDAIDTISFEVPVQAEIPQTPPIPQVRPEPPETQPAEVSANSDTSIPGEAGPASDASLAAAQYLRSLRERAKAQFNARRDLRSEVIIGLGGATGPNPFGIKHTNGGVYVPPPPIPTKRPEILEKPATGEYGLTQAVDSEPLAQDQDTEPPVQN